MNLWFALLLRSRAVRTFGAALREARRTTGDGLSSCMAIDWALWLFWLLEAQEWARSSVG